MRTIIAGGRDFQDYDSLLKAISECEFDITTVISGNCSGADMLGERYAKENDLAAELYVADWKRYGRGAGPVRNQKMADNAEALIAMWDGESRGTKSMISIAEKIGLKVHVHLTR